mgnify:CR=1 FL=1
MSSSDSVVFVVDDDAVARESFVALVSSLGFPARAFASGEEFLQSVPASQSSCAIVDFRLPGMDGAELHRHLLQAGHRLPVILISAYLDVRATARAMEQGVFRVLEKPCRDGELTQAVHEALKHDEKIREQKFYRLDFAHRMASLNERERLALELICAGNATKIIERKLGLSTRTVDRIRSAILGKMGFSSFVELSTAYGACKAIDPSLAQHRGSAATEAVTGHHPPAGLGWPARKSRAVDSRDLELLCCDLHDGVAQYLAAALIGLQAVEARQDTAEPTRRPLREVQRLLGMALQEVRDILAGETPGLLREAGLVSAVEKLDEKLTRPRGVELEFVHNLDQEPLPVLVEEAAYRILQECFSNAVCHSGSRRVRVELGRDAHVLRIEFRDWGCGFDVEAVGADHRGLRGVERRAELLGGTASIASEVGSGTIVTVALPLCDQRPLAESADD